MMKLHIDNGERLAGSQAVKLAGRIGIELSADPGACALLPLSDAVAMRFADRHPGQFMPREAFDRLTDRLRQSELGIAVVPSSTQPTAFAGPVFVKTRRTTHRGGTALSHTIWPSAADFLAAHDAAFQAYNVKPDPVDGELIFQPAWSYPAQGFELNFSVSHDCEPFFFSTCATTDSAPRHFGKIVTAQAPDGLKQEIARVCREQGIRSGIHCVEFVMLDGKPHLYDWNPRPPYYATIHHLGTPGYADAALAHMCGLTLPQLQPVFFEQRGYFDNPIDTKWFARIVEMGLLPRLDGGAIVRVSTTASSAQVASELLNQMESECVS